MDNYEFTIKVEDKDKVVVVKKPNNKQNSDADLYSSQVFAKLARKRDEDGNPSFMVRAQLNKFLEEISVYTKDDILRIGQIGEEIGQLEDKLFKGGIKKSEGRDIAINIRILRMEFMELLQRRSSYDMNTIEHYCENARFHFLIAKCISFKDGGPIYSSVEDYENDELIKPLILEGIEKLAAMVSPYDPEMERNLPENKFLVQYGYCDNELSLIDPVSKKFVNIDGKLINDDGDLIDEEGNLVDYDGQKIGQDVIGEFLDDEENIDKDSTKPKKVKKKVVKAKVIDTEVVDAEVVDAEVSDNKVLETV